MQLLDRLTAVVMAALDRLMNRLGDILDPVIRWCGPLMVALAAALIVTIPSGYTWVIAPNTVLKFSQTTHDNDDFFWSAWLGWLAHWLLLLWAMPNLVFNFAMSVGVSPGRVSAVAMSSSASSASSYIAQTDLNSSATAAELYPPRSCQPCIVSKPPRAFHCTICRSCILKMDHHCPWINQCVGHHNHVYFVLFLAYVTIACSYICAASSGPFMVCFDSPNPPEYPDNARGIVLYTFSASFAVAVAVGALFVWQLYLVSTAQTTIEYHRNNDLRAELKRMGKRFVNPLSRGPVQNFRDFFLIDVKQPWSALLYPHTIRMPTDGYTWAQLQKAGSFAVDANGAYCDNVRVGIPAGVEC